MRNRRPFDSEQFDVVSSRHLVVQSAASGCRFARVVSTLEAGRRMILIAMSRKIAPIYHGVAGFTV